MPHNEARDRSESRVRTMVEILKSLNEEERMQVFNRFCKHCGSDDPNCQCWNDE
jgi:hypothetical protein